jgi:hypothetical protein
MSRYSTIKNDKIYTWGYDRPLKEYFFSCRNTEIEESDLSEDLFEFSISSNYSIMPHPNHPDKLSYSNGEILEIMQQYDGVVPLQHMDAVALDLPF